MREVVVVVKAQAKPGKGAELLDAFGELAVATHAEEGCNLYALHRAYDDHDVIVLVERWASREALDAHLASAHMAAFRRDSADLFAEPSQITIVEAVPAGDPEKGRLAG
jgi:quinol monooxygenase YgiN